MTDRVTTAPLRLSLMQPSPHIQADWLPLSTHYDLPTSSLLLSQRTQSVSRRFTPVANRRRETARRLPTVLPMLMRKCEPDGALCRRRQVSLCPVPVLPSRFCVVSHLQGALNVQPLLPPVVMSSSKALAWDVLPTHGFRTHLTLADNVA